MTILNEQMTKDLEHVEQLKRQKRAKEMRDKKQKESLDSRRKDIIIELVLKYFPELLHFQPHQDEEDNRMEFEPLEKFLVFLSYNRDYTTNLWNLANQKSIKISTMNANAEVRYCNNSQLVPSGNGQ